MPAKKIVYIIPGFKENTDMDSYQNVARFFQDHQFQVKLVTIDWSRKVMTDYVAQFEDQYQNGTKEEIWFFGFSYGAMIAFIAATKLKPNTLVLASLSPYFKEDLPTIPQWWKTYIGKHRTSCFQQLQFSKIASNITSKTILLVGEKEPIQVTKRAKQALKSIAHSQVFICPQAKHDLKAPGYLATIEKVIKLTLNAA